MKRFTILLMSAILVSFAACKKDSLIYVTGVEIDATELELEVGGTAVLTATVLPEDATDKTVTWTSSAPDIASVDENGTISGLSAGNAVVTVTTTDGGKTAECKVQVSPANVPVTGVELDATELELEVGGTAVLTATVLPENATDKTVTWTSSAPDIASVDENGTISGLSAGNAVITVTTTDGGKTAECKITVATSSTINGHEFVDLGLSVKWGTCNVGAESPLEYGDHFAWGETEQKKEYTAETSLTYDVEMPDISGNPEYDVARLKWGGTWRMPDGAEMNELMDECTWEWTAEHGINGAKVTGPNGNSIFLPAAGFRNFTSLYFLGERGSYWSSAPAEDGPEYARSLDFDDNAVLYWFTSERFYGSTVRPVTD